MKTKLLALAILVLFSLAACRKNGCVSCMAVSKSSLVIKHTIECNKDNDFLIGFEDGLKQFYKDHGDTVTVTCIYGK